MKKIIVIFVSGYLFSLLAFTLVSYFINPDQGKYQNDLKDQTEILKNRYDYLSHKRVIEEFGFHYMAQSEFEREERVQEIQEAIERAAENMKNKYEYEYK